MIINYGWNEYWSDQFTALNTAGLLPGRITAAYAWQYEIATPQGSGMAEISGKLRHEAVYAAKRPAVGDWVAAKPVSGKDYVIQAVLPRNNCLQRQGVDGEVEAQVVAANVDACFIVQSLYGDFSLPRMDRYVALATGAQVTPAIVLTKADLVPAAADLMKQVRHTYPNLPVFMISAVSGLGLDQIRAYLQPGQTYVAMGSSGVGKSTLLNMLSETELMRTSAVREDDQRGRHTTTHRQMFRLQNGSLFIDTPGIRELALFDYDGLSTSFQDIEELAEACRFKDCLHDNEPGCAVRQAVVNGLLEQKRLDNYQKMKREQSTYRDRQILLNKKVSKAKIKRSNTHYKDYVRSGDKKAWHNERW